MKHQNEPTKNGKNIEDFVYPKHPRIYFSVLGIGMVVVVTLLAVYLLMIAQSHTTPTLDPQSATVDITTRAQLDNAIDSVVKGDVDAQRIYGSSAISDYHCIAVKTPERLEYLAALAGADVTDGKLTREFDYRGVTIYTRLGDAV